MSFTIICDKCGSTNVAVDGSLDSIAIVTCKNCSHKQYDDDFPDAE